MFRQETRRGFCQVETSPLPPKIITPFPGNLSKSHFLGFLSTRWLNSRGVRGRAKFAHRLQPHSDWKKKKQDTDTNAQLCEKSTKPTIISSHLINWRDGLGYVYEISGLLMIARSGRCCEFIKYLLLSMFLWKSIKRNYSMRTSAHIWVSPSSGTRDHELVTLSFIPP